MAGFTHKLSPQTGKNRRRIRLAALLLVCLLLASAGWYGWRVYAAPTPPEISLAQVDSSQAEALTSARREVLRSPYSAAAWGELGLLFRDCTLVEQSLACFFQAERLAPADPRWCYLQGEQLAASDPDAAQQHLRRAVRLGAKADPDNIAPRLRLAEVLLAKGDYEEAGVQLQAALEIDPDNPNVYLELGLLALANNDLDAGQRHLLRCQRSPFTQQRACSQLAALCQRKGNATAAAEFTRRAQSLPKDIPWRDPFRSQTLPTALSKANRFHFVDRLIAERRFEEAVDLLREMGREGPDFRISLTLGGSLAELGKQQESLEALSTALRLAPENVYAHYYRSRILWSQGEQLLRQSGSEAKARELLQAAAEDARAALQRKPDHALAHMVLGLSMKRLQRRREAVDSLRTAVQCGPDLAEPALFLGETLAEDGQTADARRYLEQAVRLAKPDDSRPRAALARLESRK